MANFDQALLKILRHEGVKFDSNGRVIDIGYADHKDDPGGITAYGITKKVAVENGYTGDMKLIPYDTVKKIYKLKYWNKVQGDSIPDQDIATELFDTAVNMGHTRVIEFLQRTLNTLNVKQTKYEDIKVDGDFGPKTLAILIKALNVAPYYKLIILRALDSLQCVRYIELAEKDEKFESFMPGWLRTRVGAE